MGGQTVPKGRSRPSRTRCPFVFRPLGAMLQPRVLPLVGIQAKTSSAPGKPVQVALALSWLLLVKKFLILSHSVTAQADFGQDLVSYIDSSFSHREPRGMSSQQEAENLRKVTSVLLGAPQLVVMFRHIESEADVEWNSGHSCLSWSFCPVTLACGSWCH